MALPEPGGTSSVSFLSTGLPAKPHDLRAGEDTFTSPGQSVPRGTKIAEPESKLDRTPHPCRGEQGRNSPGWGADEASAIWRTHVDIALWEGAWELDAPQHLGSSHTEALSSYAESWDAREQTLGHMSGYFQGLFAEY